MTWSDDLGVSSYDDGDAVLGSVPTPVWLVGVQLVLVGAGSYVAWAQSGIWLRVFGWGFVVAGAFCAAFYRLGDRKLRARLDYQGLLPATWKTLLHYAVLVINLVALLYTSWRGSLVVPT